MVPIIGPSYDLATPKADVQRTVNMFPVMNEVVGGKSGAYFQQVPGLDVFSTAYAPVDNCTDVLLNHFTTASSGSVLSAVGPDLVFVAGSAIQSTTFKFQASAGQTTVIATGGFSTNGLSIPMTGVSFTLKCWIYPTSYNQVSSEILFLGNTAQTQYTSLRVYDPIYFDWAVASGPSSGVIGGTQPHLNLNVWSQIVHQYNQNTGDFTTFINGQLCYTQPARTGVADPKLAFAGQTFTTLRCGRFLGYIDEVSLCIGTQVDYTANFTPPGFPSSPLSP